MQKTTADRLKEIMTIKGLKAIDIIRLAQPYCEQYNLKLTKSDMSQYLKGSVRPSQWKLTILSNALGVSEAWLMGFDVPQEKVSFTKVTSFLHQPGPASSADTLTPDEHSLLSSYRSLNEDGRTFIRAAVASASSNPAYQKDTPNTAT